ncbi:MAG TPA: Asp-tRNA(Asn)/Glu-tRNA(Gln) amidotransferase GatCAB subunit A, partial [Balneolaceae bacterium]|nr:Asp-tRNA(Asn)/Glu-tRNA(Gln) amidotransferase GatCAB subunit A [Balneolaceae bacterium]
GEIEAKDGEINAFTSTYFEEALSQADDIQEKIDNGSAGKMAGVVMGIKDVICERGKNVTCASKMLENFESVYRATVIDRLRDE